MKVRYLSVIMGLEISKINKINIINKKYIYILVLYRYGSYFCVNKIWVGWGYEEISENDEEKEKKIRYSRNIYK